MQRVVTRLRGALARTIFLDRAELPIRSVLDRRPAALSRCCERSTKQRLIQLHAPGRPVHSGGTIPSVRADRHEDLAFLRDATRIADSKCTGPGSNNLKTAASDWRDRPERRAMVWPASAQRRRMQARTPTASLLYQRLGKRSRRQSIGERPKDSAGTLAGIPFFVVRSGTIRRFDCNRQLATR
jgi:hypothetical protein